MLGLSEPELPYAEMLPLAARSQHGLVCVQFCGRHNEPFPQQSPWLRTDRSCSLEAHSGWIREPVPQSHLVGKAVSYDLQRTEGYPVHVVSLTFRDVLPTSLLKPREGGPFQFGKALQSTFPKWPPGD